MAWPTRSANSPPGIMAAGAGMGRPGAGRVISAAAAIMVTVFGAFILGDQVLVKVIGLGLSTAVLLDATLVRMVLVPSTMELLGDRNWWLPGWLDRLLPRVDIEGRGHEAAPASRPAVIGPAVTGPVVTGVRVPVTETDVVVDLVRAEYGPASASPGRGDGELVGSR